MAYDAEDNEVPEGLPGHAIRREGFVEVHLDEIRLCSRPRPACVQAVKDVARKFRANRLMLVCDRFRSDQSLADAYALGSEVAAEAAGLRLCILLTNRPVQPVDRFVELVAQNRGGRIHYFHDYAAAEAWLRDGAAP